MLKKVKILLALSFIIAGCSSRSDKNLKIQYPDGGYDFSWNLKDSDTAFPYYPLRNKIHPRDSFNYAFYGHEFFKAFNEPNMSLLPYENADIFRFVFDCWTDSAVIINIIENRIIIKEGLQVDYMHAVDSLLSEEEQIQLQVFERRFPIVKNDTSLSERARRNLDSLIKIYPRLLDRNYYDYLARKRLVPLIQPFKYRKTIKEISQEQLFNLITLINRSGYWKMPFDIYCYDRPTDGCGYSLEANNGLKYNIVRFGSCGDKPNAFDTICQAIVNVADMGKKIRIANFTGLPK